MKFRDSGSLVGGWIKRLVVIQLGGRAMRIAVDKLCTRDKSVKTREYDCQMKR